MKYQILFSGENKYMYHEPDIAEFGLIPRITLSFHNSGSINKVIIINVPLNTHTHTHTHTHARTHARARAHTHMHAGVFECTYILTTVLCILTCYQVVWFGGILYTHHYEIWSFLLL